MMTTTKALSVLAVIGAIYGHEVTHEMEDLSHAGPDTAHTGSHHYTPQEQNQLDLRVSELVQEHYEVDVARRMAEDEMHSTDNSWGFIHMIRSMKNAIYQDVGKRAGNDTSSSTGDFGLVDFSSLFSGGGRLNSQTDDASSTPETPTVSLSSSTEPPSSASPTSDTTSTPSSTSSRTTSPSSTADGNTSPSAAPSSVEESTEPTSSTPPTTSSKQTTTEPSSSAEATSSPTDETTTTDDTTSNDSTTDEKPTTSIFSPTTSNEPRTTDDSSLKSVSDFTSNFVTTVSGSVVTVTSTYKAEPSSATNEDQNKESGGGLSNTNKIVVGVVVGVGGALIIAIIALLFWLRKRKHEQHDSGKWTFWKKGEKGTDEFLNGELGVRDRNINQGSNF